ncbi:helix-turn-helix domain-containing protein [Lentzea sp. BCCO 10_0798]|uniref:Helix-turn-helix domain-containing protein n=1 Tax=Lentzea kristufekii TaxID=3095430 RepID=A0ABU4TLE9_9PSEU|nr:helix-turn-helix domain-containing protein [Lentzea sp. BCCO 10_0798]MDX8048747.1 helix-turn-helix domain-containing protein [Lentzea sp. BCCO 10_0798]
MKPLSPTFAQEVRRLRNERGLSLSQMTGLVPYSKGHLSKIENGQVHPNPEMARLFDNVLQADGHLIELANAPARPIPSDHATLLTFDSMFDHHRALGHRLSPEVVLSSLRPQVDALSSMARSADDPGLGRGLWLLAARYAEYAGWMEQERGDDASAAELTRRAVQYAAKGGDPDLEAYAYVRASEFALYRGDAHATVNFARRAGKSRSTAVQAVAAQREAQGYALAGAADRCQAALDRADELQRAVSDSRYGTTSLIDQVAIARAWSFHDLGRHAEAAAILDDQMPLIAPTALRARTRFGLRRALAHAAAGDVDHACELVEGLLDDIRQVQSATVHIDLTAFSKLLSRLRPAAGREVAGEIGVILFDG